MTLNQKMAWCTTMLLPIIVCLGLYFISFVDAEIQKTSIKFEFKQLYVNMSSDVNQFQMALVTDLTNKFNFPSGSFTDVQVMEATEGKISVDLTLEIDTSDVVQVGNRRNLEHDLKYERYFFMYTISDVMTIYGVRGSSVVFNNEKKSLIDRWNQVALEILLASMAALMCFALFIFAIYCYMLPYYRKRQQRQKDYRSQNGHSNGYVNRGMHWRRSNLNHTYRSNRTDRSDTQSIGSVTTLASTRLGPPDSVFDKLTCVNYSVPPQRMYEFL